MLKRKNRIHRDKDFDRVFKLGQSFYGKFLGLKTLSNNQKNSRLGVLISTKVSKKAVIRNHFKRQIREIIQKELPQLKAGYDLVIIVFPQILDKNFKEISSFLKQALKRLNLYKE